MNIRAKNRFHFLSTAAFLILAAFAGSARGQIIGIDFYVGSTADQTVLSTDVVGPYSSAGWYNQVDPNTAPGPGSVALLDSDNSSSGATFGFTQGGNTLSGNPIYNSTYGVMGSADNTLTPDQQLYNGAVTSAPSSWSQELVLQNVPYAQYDVYLLVNAPRVASDTPDIIGSVQDFAGGVVGGAGTTYYFQDSNQQNALIPPSLGYVQATGTTLGGATTGANYIVFTGLTDPNQTFDLLNLTPADQPYSNNISLGAVEIVNTANAVPEPSTYAMLAGAGAFLMLFRRRRK